MADVYADVVIDRSNIRLDRVFQYRVPEELQGKIETGTCVMVPFGKGSSLVSGYVLSFREKPEVEPDKIKAIDSVSATGVSVTSSLVRLAVWMRHTYGCTLIQALRTVLPVRETGSGKMARRLNLTVSAKEAERIRRQYESKHYTAKARLLGALISAKSEEAARKSGGNAQESGNISRNQERAAEKSGEAVKKSDGISPDERGISWKTATKELKVSSSTIFSMERDGILAVEEFRQWRNPSSLENKEGKQQTQKLTEEQEQVLNRIRSMWKESPEKPALLSGVTGSGKTVLYMELAEQTLREGREVIVLIPEISLSWQTVRRFTGRFGSRVAVMNSRMSRQERWDQFEKVRGGQVRIMIGPRSALFTPFENLGLIVIDEEQEGAYRNEEMPRYDAREAAAFRGREENARVLLGSATPSVDSCFLAKQGTYGLFHLKERYGPAHLPSVEIADMRKELAAGNRTMFSERLQEEIRERLRKHEQVLLFLNKRGYTGFISCRSCGHVMKCPHCDVSLTLHRNGKLICHYCGYQTGSASRCPKCGSRSISGFHAGTEKAEQMVRMMFPEAGVLRMDADTTRGKDGHDRILKAFSEGKADILIGTQMIVKGHDFPKVTLVGILMADLSLFAPDYRAAERTYQLLVQCIGRAGRAGTPGLAVIQTYHPEDYSIRAAAAQDYEAFYRQELSFRKMMGYPPASNLLAVHCSGKDPEKLKRAMDFIRRFLERIQKGEILLIGPAPESVSKVRDYYRMVIYLKSEKRGNLLEARRFLESYISINRGFDEILVQYDLNA